MFLTFDKLKVNLGHETLAYVQTGQGKETLVLLHGNVSSSLHFEPLIRALQDRYHIYAPDLRGFGDSSYNNRFDSIEELADDVIKMIEKLNLGPVSLVGWSAGGAVAQVVAGERPDLVKKLILIAPGSPKGYPVFKKGKENEVLVGEIYTSKEELAKDPVQVAPMVQILENKNATFMSYLWDLTIYNAGNKPSKEAATCYVAESLKQRNIIDIDWALCKFNISLEPGFYGMGSGLIEHIQSPILVIWGNQDLTVNRAMIDETMRLFQKRAKLLVYEGCGHSPLADRPLQLARDIVSFLQAK